MTPDDDGTTFETWRLKARRNFIAASFLAEHGGPAATICFVCQQVSEKYLKGYLLFRRQPPKRIHQLDVLLEDCITLDDSFQRLVDDAVFLKRYYIESRLYPDDLPEGVRPEEGAQALTAASQVRDFVLAQVRVHVSAYDTSDSVGPSDSNQI
jgi:HEPN domain-containing protein